MKRLGGLCELINGRGFKKSEWGDTGLRIIRIQNLNGSPDYNHTTAPVGQRNRVRPGDLLYAWSATIGPYIWHAEEAALNQHIFKVIPGPEVAKEYLYYLLLEATHELRHAMHGSTMTHILKSQLERLTVDLPSLTEQRRIVAEIEKQFTRLNVAAGIISSLLPRLIKLKQAFLHQLFERNFAKAASQTCAWRPLTSLIAEGPQNGLYKPSSHYGTGTPIVRIDDFRNGSIRRRQDLKRLNASSQEVNLYGLRPDDILINRVNSMPHLGKCAVVPPDLCPALFESNIMRLRTTEELSPRWLSLYLQSRKGRDRLIANAKQAVNQASINQADVKRTMVPIPTTDAQKDLMQCAEKYLSLIAGAADAIHTLEMRAARLRNSILAGAFSGQLAPQDPNDEPASILLERIRNQRAQQESETRSPRPRKRSAAAAGLMLQD